MTSQQGVIHTCRFSTWPQSVRQLLDGAGLTALLAGHESVLLKPNLVEVFPPPITTPVELIAAIIDFLRQFNPDLDITVAEGSGSLAYETSHTFKALGYSTMAAEKSIRLMDLNQAPCRHLVNPRCRRWPEMYLPEILFNSFLISVPVLKAHTLAQVTLTMKNMMGAAPPEHYQQKGHWKKAAFHQDINAAIFDLNRYRTPDFTILDATVGMREAHLKGPHCDPPHLTLASSADPVAIDAYGAGLLKRDWRQIGYIKAAQGILGQAEPLKIIEL